MQRLGKNSRTNKELEFLYHRLEKTKKETALSTNSMALINVIHIFLFLVVLYILLMFVLSQLFIPNLGWKRKHRPEELPTKVRLDMEKIGKTKKTKKQVLEAALDYQFITFYSKMHQALKRILFLFEKSVSVFYEKKGFLHCHHQVLMIRYHLLATKRFTEKDIKIRITNCYSNIHQYANINISDDKNKKKWVKIDPFAISLGFKFGEVLPRLALHEMKKRGIDKHNSKHKHNTD